MRLPGIITSALFILLSFMADAQTPGDVNGYTALTGTMHPLKTIQQKQPVPLEGFKDEHIVWSKRVWRKLDLREKMNHIYYYPVKKLSDRESLIQALMRGISEDELIDAYEDDEFKIPKTKEQILAELNTVDTFYVDDPDNPDRKKQVIYKNEFNTGCIKQYRIKEDWYFDQRKLQLHVRIVGLAPVKEVLANDGSLKGYKVLFWVYYPQARYVLARTEAFNRHNDAARISFDDMFIKRFFSSFVYQELNAEENTFKEFESGMEGLMESDKIKEEILNYEKTLWEF